MTYTRKEHAMIAKVCACAVFVVLITHPLAAQESQWPEKIYITIDVPFQPRGNDFSETLSFADTVRRNENVNVVTRYPATRGAVFDAGAGVRLRGNVGAGVVASWTEQSSAGSFALSLPNPLVANSPLELDGSIAKLTRRELGVHLQALYARALGSSVRVMLSAGPSIFRTNQDIVRSLDVDIMPGFRSLRFDEATISEERQTSVGFNTGADLTWRFARRMGVGIVARYSRANVTWKPQSSSGVSRTIDAHAGGLHLGGGVRFLF